MLLIVAPLLIIFCSYSKVVEVFLSGKVLPATEEGLLGFYTSISQLHYRQHHILTCIHGNHASQPAQKMCTCDPSHPKIIRITFMWSLYSEVILQLLLPKICIHLYYCLLVLHMHHIIYIHNYKTNTVHGKIFEG